MSQSAAWPLPIIGPVPPPDMATKLNANFAAALSWHSGSSRPAYATTGTQWLDTGTAGQQTLNHYDGAADRMIWRVNTTTGKITLGDLDAITFDDAVTFNTNITISGASRSITHSADTQGFTIAGGSTNSEANGAVLKLFGDEHATVPGNAYLSSATAAGSLFLRNGTTAKITIAAAMTTHHQPVTFEGDVTFSGAVGFGSSALELVNGLSFGSTVAASAQDFSKHIALYGTAYGFSVTATGNVNYVSGHASGSHVFYGGAGGTSELARFDTQHAEAGNTAALSVPRVRITATTDASETSTGHGLQIGPSSGVNLILDGNEIIFRNNGALSSINLVGTNDIPQYYTGSTVSNTAFPLGQYLVLNDPDSGIRNRHASFGVVKLGDNGNTVYYNVSGSGDGSTVAGTWRQKGPDHGCRTA